MARRNQLNTWSRPPLPEYIDIERALGNEVFEAVFEGKPPKRALADAEANIYRAIRARKGLAQPAPMAAGR